MVKTCGLCGKDNDSYCYCFPWKGTSINSWEFNERQREAWQRLELLIDDEIAFFTKNGLRVHGTSGDDYTLEPRNQTSRNHSNTFSSWDIQIRGPLRFAEDEYEVQDEYEEYHPIPLPSFFREKINRIIPSYCTFGTTLEWLVLTLHNDTLVLGPPPPRWNYGHC